MKLTKIYLQVINEESVDSLYSVKNTAELLNSVINKNGGYKSFLKLNDIYSALSDMGIAWHGGESVIKSFDKSKIKGGNRGELGYGFYFSNASKSFDYGEKITFIDTAGLKFLDGDARFSGELLYMINNYNSEPNKIKSLIFKLENQLDSVHSNKEFDKINNEIDGLKSRLNDIQKSSASSLYGYAGRLIKYIEKYPSVTIAKVAASETQSPVYMHDAFERLMSEFGYDGIQVGNMWQFSLFPYDLNKLNGRLITNPSYYISKEYHDAKTNGNNSKLVNAVENLIQG